MLDIVCVTANCPKERGYVLGGGYGKVEAILGVKQGAGFAMNSLVREEGPRCKLLSLIAISPGVKRFLVQEALLIYSVAKFAGELEEAGRHDCGGRETVDASLALRISQSAVCIHCIQRTGRHVYASRTGFLGSLCVTGSLDDSEELQLHNITAIPTDHQYSRPTLTAVCFDSSASKIHAFAFSLESN